MMAHFSDDITARALAEITRRVEASRRFEAHATPQHNVSIEMAGRGEPDPNLDWYVLTTHPQAEERVVRGLWHKGVASYLPQETVTVVRRGRKIEDTKPLFRSYLFVGFDRNAGQSLYAAGNVVGAGNLVGWGGAPVRLPSPLLADLWAAQRQGAFDMRPKTPKFQKGDRVGWLSGQFGDVIATIARAKPGERVKILFEFMGRRVSLDVDPDELKAAE